MGGWCLSQDVIGSEVGIYPGQVANPSNLGPSCCEATGLSTAPPYHCHSQANRSSQ
uniref:Uncharacterized protein n=1 Tax=Anguilla anguilla TaxID=7936 RepID=A0A0E9S0Z6_ANGAN